MSLLTIFAILVAVMVTIELLMGTWFTLASLTIGLVGWLGWAFAG